MADIINSAEQLGAITNGVVGDFLLNVDTINTSVFIGGTFDANGTRVYADDAADRSTVTIASYSGNSVTVNDVELRINNADITLNSDMTIGDNANWLYLRKSILNLNGKTLTLDKCKLLSTGLEISGLGTVNIIANDSPCWQTFANIISNGAVVNTNMPLNVYEDLTVLSGGTLCNIGRSGNGVIHIGFDDSFWTDGAVMTVSGAGSLLISQGVAIGAVIHGADAAQGIEESKLIVADGGRVDLVAAGTTNNLGIIEVSGGTLALGTLNNSGEMSITDGVLTITGKWSNVDGSSDVNVTNSTLKINKLDNDVALFLNGENTFQVEDASGSSFAVRVNDGVVFNNSYMKSSNNETLRLLGSATFNGGFAGAYLQGSSGGVGGTVTIDGLVDMSYGVEFSNNYTLNGGKIKLSGGNADGNVWGFVFQNATFTINTDIEVNGGTSAAPIHFTNATATINSTITHHYSGGEVIYIGGDNGSTVTLGETGCINGTVFIYSPSKFTVAGGTVNAGTVNNSGTFDVSGESELHIGTLTGNDVNLLDGAVLTGSTVGGTVYVTGNVTFKGDNVFTMIKDFGGVYYPETPSHWTVDAGASVTITSTARYGLGYGDKVTVNGLITDVAEARAKLDNGEEVFCSLLTNGGIVGMTNSGYAHTDNYFTVNNAYVDLGKGEAGDKSFGTHGSSSYAGNYFINFNNAVVDSNNFSFLNTAAKTVLTATGSDIRLATQFITKDVDSVFNFVNSTVKIETPNDGTDKDNVNGGTIGLVNSTLTFANAGTETQYINNGVLNLSDGAALNAGHLELVNSGTITVDHASTIAFGALTNSGTITIDTTGYTSGSYKVLDYTGTGSMDYNFVSGFGTNDKLIVVDNDLYVSDADRSIIYLDEKYQVNGEVVDGKIVGYNAYSSFYNDGANWNDYADYFNGVEKFVLTAGNTVAYGNLRCSAYDNPTITIETVGSGAALINRLQIAGDSNKCSVIIAEGSYIQVLNTGKESFVNPESTLTIKGTLEVNATQAAGSSWRTYGTTGRTIVAETGKLIFNGGQVYNTGTMTVYGEMQINAAYNDAFAKLAGDETGNYASDFYIIGGSVNVDQRAFSIGGGWGSNWGEPNSGEANFSITDGGKFTSSAVVFRGGTSAVLTIDNSSMTFGNRADGSAWTGTGGGDYVSTYDGTINLTAGTLNLGVIDFVNNGTITMDYASTIAFGALTNSGTITIDTTGYTAGEYKVLDYTGTGSKDMAFYESILGKLDHSFTVKDGDLYYRANNEVHADIYNGSGSTLMTGGAVNTFFADKSGADEIATTIHGGKIENHLVAGAYVAAGNTAAVSNVELNIDNAAEVAGKVYAGGYLYGDGNASAEAQLKVTEVNVTINGGEVTTNMYGGAHAREYGNAKVDTVNMTVTGGIHSRIYAGGWAEKGAQSHVGIANITVSGGSVDYLYGAGANADGETFVGTSNITIEGDAEVNTIFMGGRYGYSYVDIVNLTFDGDDKVLNRLSGVSSAGMDYADATNVELKTNVTADLIDYVDKFVINEDCTLTANNEFILGNRIEGGAEPGVTTFDFVTDGLDKDWTAVAGISDFANAKFSVNGSEAQLWNGTAAIEIGGYELTYDAEKKTITLANA